MIKLSIIIVSYNTEGLLKDCIESVKNNIKSLDYEVIVVDNDSKDNSVGMLKTDYPEVKIIENKFNAGFAKANNQGYCISTGEYILLLNSDTIVLDDALDKLVEFADKHKDAGIIGPRLLNSDLTLQRPCRRGFPRFINSLAYFSRLSRLFPKSKLLGSYNMTYLDDNQSHEVDAVSGACLLIRRTIVDRIGLLDEDYFMHFEDIDLCFKVKKEGWKVFYVHDSRVIHLKGQSSKLRSRGVIKNFYDSALTYYRRNYKPENFLGYVSLKLIILCMKSLSMVLFTIKTLFQKVGTQR